MKIVYVLYRLIVGSQGKRKK